PVVQDLDGSDEFRTVRVIERNFLALEDSSSSASARHDSDVLARVIHEEFLVPIGSRIGSLGPSVAGRLGSADWER
ncbi:MAG TPA: hypothetical protein VK116_18695, partial [Planctomycetota bacterium]|nr:hypothetical protein [Planctomycetota bacterium]